MVFYWAEWNKQHIAVHGVSPAEAKEVAARPRQPYPLPVADDKWLVRGQTSSGRYLQVIYVFHPIEEIDVDALEPDDWLQLADIDQVAYVIHARELLDRERFASRRK